MSNNNFNIKTNKRDFIAGFSKLNRKQRIEVLQNRMGENVANELDSFLHQNPGIQQVFSKLIENYLTNFYLPIGIVPNVMVNGDIYLVPLVIEESSVVAAASRAAGFWSKNGGFKTEVLGTKKKGQVHFTWSGSPDFIPTRFSEIKKRLTNPTESITGGMQQRGGGITDIQLVDLTQKLPNYYQIDVSFNTIDAMGANFINSCLEAMASELQNYMNEHQEEGKLEVIMAILSNHTPESAVKCTITCAVDDLAPMSGEYSPADFARRFKIAVNMAKVDVSRAVTHNKGIYNGVDGVVLATGNDWRAVEAAGHAYAAKDGSYKALSDVEVKDGIFTFSITLPLSVGTVGGLTKNHPLAKISLKLLGNPSAAKLMQIIAALGMANNFSAVTSLVTSGIQKGHMKMHLANILSQLGATEQQKVEAKIFFEGKTITYSAVEQFLKTTPPLNVVL